MEKDELNVQEGRPPSKKQEFFQQKYWEMKSNFPDKHDELAKSFIALVGTLTTLYFAVVTFSKILTKPEWFRAIALMPILLWLFAIISALIALLPKKYIVLKDAPASVENFVEEITEHKYRCVRYCGWLTFAGLVVLMITLVLYVFNAGGPETLLAK